MQIRVRPGRYVVAVSGGVDSMVLLEVLRQRPKLDLTVAHFDHGIREDSAEERKLVRRIARQYGLQFISAKGNLGANASEALAREARYAFLRRIQTMQGARAVITAHHQDDMLETAIVNLLRGTGRKGLSSLTSRPGLLRPMLEWTKKDIRAYARQHQVQWREDSTNEDEKYLRNYIRHNILSHFTEEGRAALLQRIKRAGRINQEIDQLLQADLEQQPSVTELARSWYISLPYAVAKEMMAAFLRRNGIIQFDRLMIDRLAVLAKTALPGKQADVNATIVVQFNKDNIKLLNRQTSDNP